MQTLPAFKCRFRVGACLVCRYTEGGVDLDAGVVYPVDAATGAPMPAERYGRPSPIFFSQVAPRINHQNVYTIYVGRWTFINGFLTKRCENR